MCELVTHKKVLFFIYICCTKSKKEINFYVQNLLCGVLHVIISQKSNIYYKNITKNS